ncbi:WcaI family glycosyltransferase [Acinetobacter qingfengensis]|uniref:Glycosyl transferase n=1 Tax=Acinetobacter qingfengensis TaxID=1262585 RepID=A0A1E7RD40_9GAMM|nr:glycosyltransferase WbuB [Acinetobacter qingfengensis]KAA8732056.1 WcaI family glycosyltransferase [Acinetobacter qingfengensis]OEY97137.1 glycosyl transferase [Acinetobacter qingfengensis]
MKILFYGINFSPELTGIGKYTGEMAAWFAAQGHDVHVITAPPYYPAWKISENYKNSYVVEQWQGVTVYRVPLWVPDKPSGLKRIIHLASFAVFSLPTLIKQWWWKPDIIWVVEPPLVCAPAAVLSAKIIGAKSWLHVQDYEVNAAFDMGLIKGQKLRRFVENVERWLMSCFDRVSSISGQMLALAKNKGITDSKIILFPNWVDISAIRPLTDVSPYRKELGIGDDAIVALYSGNMGGKQGLEILAEIAKILSLNPLSPNIEFIFCGNGAGRADLEQLCQNLPHVRFLDLQPLERLSELLGIADIHLLPQRADAADLVMPSKLTGMLASGRAVIATADLDTELGRVVAHDAECGLIVQPENAQAMADAVLTLANNAGLRQKFGKNGRLYAESKLDQDTILRKFEQQLQLLMDSK